jgi:hypothetical protein
MIFVKMRNNYQPTRKTFHVMMHGSLNIALQFMKFFANVKYRKISFFLTLHVQGSITI